MDGSVEVAVELAALDHLIRVACAVELELIHAILVDHLEASVAEIFVVLRPGESQASLIRFEAVCSGIRKPLLFWLGVSAPWREPDPGRRVEVSGSFGNIGQ